MRYLEDGSLLYSTSEDCPKLIKGYVKSNDNPRLFIPEAGPCTHRVTNYRTLPCGKKKPIYFCSLHNSETNMEICNECEDITFND